MRHTFVLLLTTTLLACGPAVEGEDFDAAVEASELAASNDYGLNGPEQVTTTQVSYTGPSKIRINLNIYVPASSGPHPVVLFSAGAKLKGQYFRDYGQRLASWGIVAVLKDDSTSGLFPPSSTKVLPDVVDLVSRWLPEQNASSTSPLRGKLDLSRVGLAGHSRGGQVSFGAAAGALKGQVKAVFGVDPVDGSQSGVQVRTTIGQLGVPSAFMGETTNSTGGTLGQSCAPKADNYQVLYRAAPSPSVELTAVNADHMQFLDTTGCGFTCGLCSKGSANKATTLAMTVKYVTAFFARELKGDRAVGATFAGAGLQADIQAGRLTMLSK